MNRSPRSNPRILFRRGMPLVGGTLVALLATLAVADQSTRVAPSRAASQGRSVGGRTMVDPAVQPAGGGGCRECGPAGCRHCHKHHHGCRDGVCVPSCPVRPGTFGYYGTQWRRWPGQGVVPVSATQSTMPVQPPKSAVPSADEESFAPKPDELPEPDAGMLDADGPVAPEPAVEPAEAPAAEDRSGVTEPTAEEKRPAPEADNPRVEPAEKPAAKPADDNLFDDSSARKVRRKIPVHTASGMQAASSGRVVAAAHAEEDAPARPVAGGNRSVPRVAFDPRNAAPRMDSTRSNQRR